MAITPCTMPVGQGRLTAKGQAVPKVSGNYPLCSKDFGNLRATTIVFTRVKCIPQQNYTLIVLVLISAFQVQPVVQRLCLWTFVGAATPPKAGEAPTASAEAAAP